MEEVAKRNRAKAFIIIVVVVLLIVGGFFAVRNFQQSSKKVEEKVVTPTVTIPTEEPTEEPTPEETGAPTKKPTPSAIPTTGQVQKAQELNIQVLNGSGKEGVAGEGRDFLKGKGYQVVETGNADNFDYENVTVRLKDSRKKFLDTVRNDLSEKYTLATGSGTLSEDSLFDVSIIVGK